MRKFLLGVLLLPAMATAEPVTVEKPVQCDKTERVINYLLNSEYKEKPIWVGSDDLSRFSIFSNNKTGSWTIVQFNETVACILGAGERSKLVLTGPKT